MLDIERLAGLLTRWPVSRKANSQKLLQFVRIHDVPIAAIAIETNQHYIHLQWNLKRNLNQKEKTTTEFYN